MKLLSLTAEGVEEEAVAEEICLSGSKRSIYIKNITHTQC